jgi:hypothetical protein
MSTFGVNFVIKNRTKTCTSKFLKILYKTSICDISTVGRKLITIYIVYVHVECDFSEFYGQEISQKKNIFDEKKNDHHSRSIERSLCILVSRSSQISYVLYSEKCLCWYIL